MTVLRALHSPTLHLPTLHSPTPLPPASALLRPAGAGDTAALRQLYSGLLPQTLRRRFHCAVSSLSAQRLTELSGGWSSGGRRVDLVAVALKPDGTEHIVAHGCWQADGPDSAEFALVVADGQQGQGLGFRLLSGLMHHATLMGLRVLHAQVLSSNGAMLALLRRMGLRTSPDASHPEWVGVEVDAAAWCSEQRAVPVAARPVVPAVSFRAGLRSGWRACTASAQRPRPRVRGTFLLPRTVRASLASPHAGAWA